MKKKIWMFKFSGSILDIVDAHFGKD